MTKRILAGAILAVVALCGVTAATDTAARGGYSDWPTSARR
jgi:hypothetical protein